MAQSFLKLKVSIPDELKLAGTAIYLADTLGISSNFWSIVLLYPTPSSFNQAGGLAVRQFVETILTNLGPVEILRRVTPVLLDPNSTWSSLGLSSINDQNVGTSLTLEMKQDLIEILNLSAKTFLEGIIKDLLLVTGNVDFGYGYGYPIDDIFKQNYGFGYGVSYDTLNYFDLLS